MYHPEIDGATERANQIIQPYLHAYIIFAQDNWEDFLGITQLTINNRVAIFMGINPFFMTYRYNTPLLDYDIATAAGTKNRGAHTPAEMGNKITRKLQETSDFT